jgi:hypothetical protein
MIITKKSLEKDEKTHDSSLNFLTSNNILIILLCFIYIYIYKKKMKLSLILHDNIKKKTF